MRNTPGGLMRIVSEYSPEPVDKCIMPPLAEITSKIFQLINQSCKGIVVADVAPAYIGFYIPQVAEAWEHSHNI